jgi:hypothetical protein
MPVQLSYGGVFWRLPKEWTLESIQENIKKAMTDRSPLSIDLDGGATLILNSARLGYVVVFDDQGDPSKAPASWNQDSMVSSGRANVISTNPYTNPYSVISSGESVISSGESVISYNPNSVISSGAGSITISWSADPRGRGSW